MEWLLVSTRQSSRLLAFLFLSQSCSHICFLYPFRHRLATSDRFFEGEVIQFSDQTGSNDVQGVILELGWTNTILLCSDNSVMSVPNRLLWKNDVRNLSRATHSQVRQTLRFQYKEAHKLPTLLKSVKDEIRLACPSIVTDGSLPFRVHWTSFGQSHLQVEVEAHFQIAPLSNEYWDNQQRVLQAINRAVKIHQVELAVTSGRDVGSVHASSGQKHYFASGSARVVHNSNADRSQ